jgi:hypothetical protein
MRSDEIIVLPLYLKNRIHTCGGDSFKTPDRNDIQGGTAEIVSLTMGEKKVKLRPDSQDEEWQCICQSAAYEPRFRCGTSPLSRIVVQQKCDRIGPSPDETL